MFDVSATAYDSLIGRYSPRLAVAMADAAGSRWAVLSPETGPCESAPTLC